MSGQMSEDSQRSSGRNSIPTPRSRGDRGGESPLQATNDSLFGNIPTFLPQASSSGHLNHRKSRQGTLVRHGTGRQSMRRSSNNRGGDLPAPTNALYLFDKPKVMQMQLGDHFITSPNTNNIKVGFQWDHRTSNHVDVDVSAVCFSKDGRKTDHVSFGKRTTRDNAMMHTGDDKGQDKSGDDEAIMVNLQNVAPETAHVLFVLNVFTSNRSLDDVENLVARVEDVNFANQNYQYSVELLRYPLTVTKHKQRGVAAFVFTRQRETGAAGGGGQPAPSAMKSPSTGNLKSPNLNNASFSGKSAPPTRLPDALLNSPALNALQPAPPSAQGTGGRPRRLSWVGIGSPSPATMAVIQNTWRIVAVRTPLQGKTHRHVTGECEELCQRIISGWLPVAKGKHKTGGEESDLVEASTLLANVAEKRARKSTNSPQRSLNPSHSAAFSSESESPRVGFMSEPSDSSGEDEETMRIRAARTQMIKGSRRQLSPSARRADLEDEINSLDTATPVDIRDAELEAMYEFGAANISIRPRSPGRPRVVRKNIRQYSVGRAVQRRRKANDPNGDDSEDMDEDVEEWMLAAVFPHYSTQPCVRYEELCYSIGTDKDDLLQHFLRRRGEFENLMRRERRQSLSPENRYLVDYVHDDDEPYPDPRNPPPEIAQLLARQGIQHFQAFRTGSKRFGDTPPSSEGPSSRRSSIQSGLSGYGRNFGGRRRSSMAELGPNGVRMPRPPRTRDSHAGRPSTTGGRGGARGGSAHGRGRGGKRKQPGLFSMLAGSGVPSATGGKARGGGKGKGFQGFFAGAHANGMLYRGGGRGRGRAAAAKGGGNSPHSDGSGPESGAEGGDADRRGGGRGRRKVRDEEIATAAFMSQIGSGSTAMLSNELQRWINAYLKAETVKHNLKTAGDRGRRQNDEGPPALRGLKDFQTSIKDVVSEDGSPSGSPKLQKQTSFGGGGSDDNALVTVTSATPQAKELPQVQSTANYPPPAQRDATLVMK